MRSSKSRSRNKNRSRSPQGGGNIVSRTFDSSGPEGKVRGTPAQIIEKYNQLARDAQLSGDRVAVENFQQHAEHYTRLLAAAQKEVDARQQGNQGQQNYNQNNPSGQNNGHQGGGHQGGGGGQNDGHQQGGNQPGGNVQGGNAQGGGQDGDGRDASQQDAPQTPPQSPAPGRRQGGNRRREKPEIRDEDAADRDARSQYGDPRVARSPDVMDAPEGDSGLVETPEARATISPAEPKAEKPKRTRVRKKAPAEVPAEPASDD